MTCLPPSDTLIEIADFAGRGNLATYDDTYLRQVPCGFRIWDFPDLWRAYVPPVGITELELELPNFAPNPNVDEPFFTLVARDPVAPPLIDAWAYLRQGQFTLAQRALEAVFSSAAQIEPQRNDDPQILAAFRVSGEMTAWANKKAVRAE